MKKTTKNLITSILPQAVNIISNLILPGLIIAKFGSEINGLVSTTRSVISYISLVGAGIATAVTQALYSPVSNGNTEIVKGMMKSANTMFNRYGLIYIVTTFAVACFYPYLIDTNINYFTIVGLLLVMSLSGASEFFAIGRCRALLYAHQKVYVCSLIQALSLLLSLILAIFMLKINVSIIWVQFAISFVYVLRGALLTSYVEKCYPQYSRYKEATPVDAVVEKRNDAMIHQLSGLAVTSSQVAILTFLVDLKAASIYSVYNIVLYGIKMICSNLCTAITPYLGNKYALKKIKELQETYNITEMLFFLFTTFFLSVTAVMLNSFVSIYTKGSDINYTFPVFGMLFVASSAFYILKLPGTALINVAGHFKETRGRALVEAALSVVLNVVLTVWIGMNGVLIGTGIALGWRCVDTIVYTSRYVLEVSINKSLKRLIVAIVNIGVIWYIGNSINYVPTGYLEWSVMAFLTSIVVIIVLLTEMAIIEKENFFKLIYKLKLKNSGTI